MCLNKVISLSLSLYIVEGRFIEEKIVKTKLSHMSAYTLINT